MRKFVFFGLLLLTASFAYSLEYVGTASFDNSPEFHLYKSTAEMDNYRLFNDGIREALSGNLLLLEAVPHVEMPNIGADIKNMMRKHGADLAAAIVRDFNGPSIVVYLHLQGKYYLYRARFYAP